MTALRNAGGDTIQYRVFDSSNCLLLIPSFRTGQGSQTQTQQSPGGSASSAGDQMWGIPRIWQGILLRNSMQKPLQEHAGLHAETQ